MILIIGLGNPGKKYQKTRHNFGFRIVDELQKNPGFSDWKLKKKNRAEISEGNLADQKIILAKPQTFMNESSKAVKTIINHLSLITENLWVIHDDIDLPLGKIKITKNRGGAGHKGVQSIINELKTKNFVRFRLGIKPQLKAQNLDKFVLQNFNKAEEKIIKEVINKTCLAIEMATKDGAEKAMNKFNK